MHKWNPRKPPMTLRQSESLLNAETSRRNAWLDLKATSAILGMLLMAAAFIFLIIYTALDLIAWMLAR